MCVCVKRAQRAACRQRARVVQSLRSWAAAAPRRRARSHGKSRMPVTQQYAELQRAVKTRYITAQDVIEAARGSMIGASGLLICRSFALCSLSARATWREESSREMREAAVRVAAGRHAGRCKQRDRNQRLRRQSWEDYLATRKQSPCEARAHSAQQRKATIAAKQKKLRIASRARKRRAVKQAALKRPAADVPRQRKPATAVMRKPVQAPWNAATSESLGGETGTVARGAPVTWWGGTASETEVDRLCEEEHNRRVAAEAASTPMLATCVTCGVDLASDLKDEKSTSPGNSEQRLSKGATPCAACGTWYDHSGWPCCNCPGEAAARKEETSRAAADTASHDGWQGDSVLEDGMHENIVSHLRAGNRITSDWHSGSDDSGARGSGSRRYQPGTHEGHVYPSVKVRVHGKRLCQEIRGRSSRASTDFCGW